MTSTLSRTKFLLSRRDGGIAANGTPSRNIFGWAM